MDKESEISSTSNMSINSEEREHYEMIMKCVTMKLEQYDGPALLEEEEILNRDVKEEEKVSSKNDAEGGGQEKEGEKKHKEGREEVSTVIFSQHWKKRCKKLDRK